MAGFSSVTGLESIMFADNASFDGTERDGAMTTDGQLWIGSTSAVGGHVKLGQITSTGGTITVTYDSPNINIEAAGGTIAVDSFAMQTGTSPVVPTGAGLVTFNGSSVAAGTNPVRTRGTGPNTMQLEVQTAPAIAATDATRIGLAAFDSAAFDVDANGFVQLNGGGIASTAFDVQANTPPGTDPVVPTAAGVVTINGAVVAAHAVPLETRSRAANAYNIEVQYSSAIAATDGTRTGVAAFDSAAFDVDATGFVQLNGGGIAATAFDVQANTAPGTDPVVPTAAGVVTVNGAAVAAHSVPIETRSRAANAYNIEVQYASAAAGSTASQSGIAHFDSTDFTVDANGFVALAGAGAGQTITGDSGGALPPSGGNWNILGRSGSKTAGSGSTITVRSPPYADVGGSGTSVLNSGEFVTATATRTLPATASVTDGDLVEYIATTANVLTLTANTNQRIRLGNVQTAVAGTAISTAIGDSITLRFRATDQIWYATSSVGIWGLT